MRDDDGGAVAHELLERVAHRLLVHRVEMRRRLVEDEHRCVLEERARDGHALALAAREPDAPFPDSCLQAVRQRRDEGVERGVTHRVAERHLGRFRLREENVGAQGLVEQIGILGDQRDALAQIVEPVLPQIVAVRTG